MQRAVGVLEHHLHAAEEVLVAARGQHLPSTSTIRPVQSGLSPDSARSTVDLPEPLSPTRPKLSPRSTLNETFFTASVLPKRTLSAAISIMSSSHDGSRCITGSRALLVAECRQALQQAARIGMVGAQQVGGAQLLHHASGIHHHDAVAEMRNQRQIVADQDQPHAAARHEILDQAQDLRLHRGIQRAGGFVGDQQFRVRAPASSRSSRAGPCRRTARADRRRRHGPGRGSAPGPAGRSPPGRPACGCRRDARARPRRSAAPAVITGFSEYFGSCRIRPARLPRMRRIASSSARSTSMSSKVSLSAVITALRRQQPQDRARGQRLARTRFADDAELLLAQRQRDVAHRLGEAVWRGEAECADCRSRPAIAVTAASDPARRACRRPAG